MEKIRELKKAAMANGFNGHDHDLVFGFDENDFHEFNDFSDSSCGFNHGPEDVMFNKMRMRRGMEDQIFGDNGSGESRFDYFRTRDNNEGVYDCKCQNNRENYMPSYKELISIMFNKNNQYKKNLRSYKNNFFR